MLLENISRTSCFVTRMLVNVTDFNVIEKLDTVEIFDTRFT